MDDSNNNDNWKSKTCYKDQTSHKETGWAFNPNEDPDDPDCYDPIED